MNPEKNDSEKIDIIDHQIRRMSKMRDYPTGDDGEWLRIARQFAPCARCGMTFQHHAPEADCRAFLGDRLSDAISQLMEDCTRVPACAELKAALISRTPDTEPTWRREVPSSRGPASYAWNAFIAENEAIMVRAQQNEKDRDEKDKQVREYLHIRDFMDVDFPQRWWAERQLGFPLEPIQNQDVDDWLHNLAPGDKPGIVAKSARSTRAGESLPDMGFVRPGVGR